LLGDLDGNRPNDWVGLLGSRRVLEPARLGISRGEDVQRARVAIARGRARGERQRDGFRAVPDGAVRIRRENPGELSLHGRRIGSVPERLAVGGGRLRRASRPFEDQPAILVRLRKRRPQRDR